MPSTCAAHAQHEPSACAAHVQQKLRFVPYINVRDDGGGFHQIYGDGVVDSFVARCYTADVIMSFVLML